jgi:UV DNA damage endonuclease
MERPPVPHDTRHLAASAILRGAMPGKRRARIRHSANLSPAMPPHLGLVCNTVSTAVRYPTNPPTRLLEHSPDAQRKLLDELYRSNIQVLDGALRYCGQAGIRLYRMPSSIFPFADDDIGREVLAPFAATLARTGARALERGIRLVMHPDQFVVLSSDSAGVVENSIKILQMHADIMDLLAQPRTPWDLLVINGGMA